MSRLPTFSAQVSCIMLFSTVYIAADQQGHFFEIENDAFFHDMDPVWEGKTGSLLSCSLICARRDDCQSASFVEGQETCVLHKTHAINSGKFFKQHSFYFKKVLDSSSISSGQLNEAVSPAGTIESSAVHSCWALTSRSPLPPSGTYWIDPDGGSHNNAFKAYCEMDTDGGGWTLVWSYTFTDYAHFTASSNAVTPRPNWPKAAMKINVPISTRPPMNETDYSAMDFLQWKHLGKQFLVKSNLNNWLSCQPGSGSLVEWQRGNISCLIVNRVTGKCNDKPAPSIFTPESATGPMLYTAHNNPGHYYYFDQSTLLFWPTHDPCGENQKPDNFEDLANPHGNIFIR